MNSRFDMDFMRIFSAKEIDPNDRRAAQIQADIDAERRRADRARRQEYFPPGSVAHRTLNEATGPDGDFKPIV